MSGGEILFNLGKFSAGGEILFNLERNKCHLGEKMFNFGEKMFNLGEILFNLNPAARLYQGFPDS